MARRWDISAIRKLQFLYFIAPLFRITPPCPPSNGEEVRGEEAGEEVGEEVGSEKTSGEEVRIPFATRNRAGSFPQACPARPAYVRGHPRRFAVTAACTQARRRARKNEYGRIKVLGYIFDQDDSLANGRYVYARTRELLTNVNNLPIYRSAAKVGLTAEGIAGVLQTHVGGSAGYCELYWNPDVYGPREDTDAVREGVIVE